MILVGRKFKSLSLGVDRRSIDCALGEGGGGYSRHCRNSDTIDDIRNIMIIAFEPAARDMHLPIFIMQFSSILNFAIQNKIKRKRIKIFH